MERLRIALLAHSTNPRGGVVHALELGEALTALGHEAVVHAPDASGRGFFRPTAGGTALVPATPVVGDTAAMVAQRIEDYVAWFTASPARRAFDVFHAGDGISGNALAHLVDRGLIPAFARTVHHLDSFADERLAAWDDRALRRAARVFCVSRHWRHVLARDHGVEAILVGNGVDIRRFSPIADERDAALAARLLPPIAAAEKTTYDGSTGTALSLPPIGEETTPQSERTKVREAVSDRAQPGGPVLLAVGGIEKRKNTLRILEAFRLIRSDFPSAKLVIAGGASLLDHSSYGAAFAEALAAGGLPDGAVVVTGRVADGDMPALYRLADALVFPSLSEGFGLAVLEAMASGVPVVVSAIPPFTEYLATGDAAWCDPDKAASIGAAIRRALDPDFRDGFIAAGFDVAAHHDWRAVAERHLATYAALAALREPLHA